MIVAGMRFVVTSLAVSLAASAVGCAGKRQAGARGYETVKPEPARDADSAATQNALAVDLIERHKYDDAERLLKRALTADITHGPAHNNLGKVYFQRGQYYLAAWEFQYAVKLMPGQPEPRNNLGLVFEQVGKFDEAIGWYGKATELAPDTPLLIGTLARARVRRGDRDEDTRAVLARLVATDSRPQWVAWAKEQLALMPKPRNP